MNLHRVHYLDASVLVKLLIKEEGTETIEQYVKDEYTSTFYTTTFCFAEALGVLKTKFLRKDIDQETYFQAGDKLRCQICDEGTIELANIDISDDAIFEEVEDVARRYNLDIVDAYQIVTIKKDYFFRNSLYSQPILITADKKLAKAARKERLKTWDCLKEDKPNLNNAKSSA